MSKTSVLKTFTVLAIAVTTTYACQKEQQHAGTRASRSAAERPEEAFPGQTGQAMKGYLGGRPVTYSLINGEAVFQGDILLPATAIRNTPVATEGTGFETASRHWPNDTLVYSLDASLNQQQKTDVARAMNMWSDSTNVRFREKRSGETAYVLIRNSSGNSATLGYTGRLQYVNIARSQEVGRYAHELGHALGLFHEHTRKDRDQYVTINFDNIQSGYEHNYDIYSGYDTTQGFEVDTLDFGSVMMYGSYYFAVDGSIPTMTKSDGSTFSVQRAAPSASDYRAMRHMYPN
ncbi:M12 family metallopeptidase [Chitinophaga vietnamensis]|uniref:M12 family metallopeptidase n=1 Tax=Chitinophaga vietnamensis TaxID=2593957 RepID=UPI001177AFA0|nr:M12 family metallopeptidase [Chitinophaga vietnamensis]